jgi:hypothetical protein
MIKIKIKKAVVGLVTLLMLGTSSSAVAYSSNAVSAVVEAYALNTVAGQSTVLRTSAALSNTDLIFDITQPDGKIVSVSAVSNNNGIAIAELSDYYTKKSGTYNVGVRYESSAILGNYNSFEVFSSDVSLAYSSVTPSDQVVETGKQAEVLVSLKDDYGNPVQDHFLNLVSADGSYSKSLLSNDAGTAKFLLNSSVAGLKSYTVNDLTTDIRIDDEARVLFVDSSFDIFEGYYPTLSSMGSGAGTVDSFAFEDPPPLVEVGELYSLTVTAIDVDENTVTDYDGTIGFVVTSDNGEYAETPVTYEYEIQDQGSHTFSLAFKFLEVGDYTLKVADLENTDVTEDYEFVVTEASGTPSTGTGDALEITNPTAGTVSSNTLVISGSADPASHIKIFDNDVEIEDLVVGVSGQFSHTTGLLNDGSHVLHIAELNEVGTIVETSDSVTVIVDTEGAAITSVQITPDDTLDPGEAFSVKLVVNDTLSKAQLLIAGNVYDMDFNLGGFYELDVAAPIEFGEYDLDFVLIDELGNQSKFEAEGSISVGEAPPVVEPEVDGPGNVTELIAEPADGRVILTWTAPEAGENPILKYRVFYGVEAALLSDAVDTFTDSTTWYVPDLKNGQIYYFAVQAIDGLGNTSENFGHIAATTPTSVVVIDEDIDLDVENGSAGSEVIDEMVRDASDSGPAINGLILFSIMAGFFFVGARRKRSRF